MNQAAPSLSSARHARLFVALAMAGSTLLTWAPFLGKRDLLYRYWDGPHYAYLAKTLYRVPIDHPFTPYHLTPAYYATHFPLYPLSIRLLVPLTLGHYFPAMLLSTLLASVVAAILFFEILVRWDLVASPVWTGILFAFLPPRWVLYHSVGASEPLFMVFVFAAFLAYAANRTGPLILAIALASLTRIMGVLLVPAFMMAALLDRRPRQVLWLPVSLLGVAALFCWHRVLYGDFFAYFTRNVEQSGHIARVPLRLMWDLAGAGDLHGTELTFGLFALYGIGTLALARHRAIFFYGLAFLGLNLFVFHYDLARMFLPIAPFSLLVGYDRVLSQKPCRWGLPLVVILDVIYTRGLIPTNVVVPWVFESLGRVLR